MHVRHYTTTNSNYNNSEDRFIESWARFGQYLLTVLEYRELGVAGNLESKDTISVAGKEQIWIEPDSQYNFQGVTVNSTTEYTPFFIDLYDYYNQRDYYDAKYFDPQFSRQFPDDMISGIPTSTLQSYMLYCRTLSDVRDKLKELAQTHQHYYHLTEENINSFF